MGTGYQPKALVQLARTICRVLAVFHGWHYRSKLVARLSFLGYNKGLEGRTAHDWLNRDPVEVDRYRAVTGEDIRSFSRRTLRPENSSTLIYNAKK